MALRSKLIEDLPQEYRRTHREYRELLSQQEGISFASFLKHATLEYIKESLEYQRLVDSGEMSKQQNAVPEAFSSFEETINNTLLSMYESINRMLNKIEWLAENGIYYQFYF
jgi:hypothetical protein